MSKKFLLALDAGHGLNTPGKRCLKAIDLGETREWWLNNRISNYIAERATLYEGFETMRVDDPTGKTDISLPERCRRSNSAGADLYISNHHNAGINGGSGGGLVAFCMRGATTAKGWRDVLYEAVLGAGGLRGNRANPVQEMNFDVLVGTKAPAVLIEYGFMDSTTDVPIILTDSYSRTVGYAVADCIANRVGLSLKPSAQPNPIPAVSVAGFSDVDPESYYANAVKWAKENGITNGVDPTHFSPNAGCSRAEVIEMLYRAFSSGKE